MKYPFWSLVIGCFFVCDLAMAAEEPVQVSQAKAVVEQYKTLRKHCAESVEKERVACFAELGAHNESYQQAKKFLARGKPSDVNNLHMVSNAY